MMKIRLLALLLFPSVAYAFPIADGAGTVSTLIGVISSLVFALIPSSSKYKKKIIVAITCSVIAAFVLLGTIMFLGVKSSNHDEQILSVRQSRPMIQLQKDVVEREALSSYALSNSESDFMDKNHQNIHFYSSGEWKNQAPDANLELVVIGYDEDRMGDQPNSFKSFTFEQEKELLEYVLNSNKNVVLYEHNGSGYIVRISKLLYEKSGEFYPVYVRKPIRGAQPIDESRVKSLDGNIFAQNLYELRTSRNVRETHTVVNAMIFTNADLALTPNWKLRELFDGKQAVFVDYYPSYTVANHYLSEAGIKDYSFVKGGLESHFKNHNLTPTYYNNRVIEPELVTRLYKEGNTLRFICMAKGQCLDNLPEKDTYVISYRDMDRKDYYAAIQSLPKEYEYVAVSSNQETSGLAIMTGYLLVESGHNYLGELPAYSRFSLENIRHHVAYWFKHDSSLAEYQAEVYSRYDAANQIRGLISDYGWIAIFCLAGLICRVICFPMQYMIYKSYYQPVKLGVIASLAGLAVPVLVVVSYLTLDSFISDYAVVSHTEINKLFNQNYEHLKLIFVGLVALQSFISFPERKAIALSIIGLVSAVYGFGYMNLISLPMMWFLLAGECVSILLQAPFYVSYRREKDRQANGWALKPIKNGMLDYPEKWLNLANTGCNSGVLVSTNMSEDAFNHRIKALLPSRALIVRSSSSKKEENSLGGYFESYTCDRDSAFRFIAALQEAGCDHAIIQEFVSCTIYGAASSIAMCGKGISLSYGKHGKATEGGADTSNVIICRNKGVALSGKDTDGLARRVHDTVRKIEKSFGLPVAIEFAVDNESVVVLQIREQKNTSALKLYPHSIEEYVLAEDYLAKCSYTTGELLERVTNGDFAYVDGFVYKKRKASRKGVSTISQLEDLGQNVSLLLDDVIAQEQHNPGFLLAKLELGIDLYTKLYATSQSIVSKNASQYAYNADDYEIFVNGNNSEIDVHSDFSHTKRESTVHMTRRDYVHHLITLCNYVIHICLRELSADKVVPHNLSISALLSGEGALIVDNAYYASEPLSQNSETTETTVLSAGEVSGLAWHTSNLEAPESGNYVLIGKEVSSQWVKHLRSFRGIVTIYGNENSHLALSARELSIPYIKVSQERYNTILEQGYI